MCQSRIFDELYLNGQETYAFVPYADLINHKDPADTSWEFNESENCFIMKATGNIKRGDEVYSSYGSN